MGRKKKNSGKKKGKSDIKSLKIAVDKEKIPKKKQEKVEIIEKKEAPRGKRWNKNEIELEDLTFNSFEQPLRGFAPTLQMRQSVAVEPLELEIADVPTASINNEGGPKYENFKPGDYNPKDSYQSKGVSDAYEGGTPGMIPSSSQGSNFSKSNFGAATTNFSRDGSGYPGSSENSVSQQSKYDTDMEKAKKDRQRTI